MKNYVLRITVLFVTALVAAACNAPKKELTTTEPAKDTVTVGATISETSFGSLPDGTQLKLFKLRNASGMEADITNYGGIITALRTFDRDGKLEDVVLGYDSLAGYLKAPSFFGALVGRYGNRIANGKFKLDGKTYTLVQNNGKNHLHGGKRGFDNGIRIQRTDQRLAQFTDGLAAAHLLDARLRLVIEQLVQPHEAIG